ncbi:GyrI-like domain-containing protein [Lacticaseibacillus kribbianus]|uniref:GyrI-like domain-containing protein n=1 Tax=Lacticaseibacillus kribbianus TaxID=2926292 RepID=UPI001CD79092|nr:GyrI-like domain-containing protein [Lacticaseibacillus kribbianus]
MKHVWRQAEKNLYLPKDIALIDVPAAPYVTLDGTGDPNTPAFGAKIQALYTISYAIRNLLKAEADYTVYPLEGLWTTPAAPQPGALNKTELIYRIGIRQPERATPEIFQTAMAAAAKKGLPELAAVRLSKQHDGLCLQAIHVGPFDTEGETFAKLEAEAAARGLRLRELDGYHHREIYLSDFRRVAPAATKTLLRLGVAEAASC